MLPDTLKVACVQLNAQSDRAANLAQATLLIEQAATSGAKFVLTPENTCGLYPDVASRLAAAVSESEHPAINAFSALAKKHHIFLLAGSLAIKDPSGKVFNRSYLFNPEGTIIAQYDKIHLFDVDLPNGDKYRESDTSLPGLKAVVAQTSIGCIGLSICYDVRFPQLYRALAKAGAQIITVPSAFTVPTGKAHWSTLLRARAIECGAFILAPAQTGTHNGNRETYGHSMIISPWGEVLAEASTQTGFITAEIKLSDVSKVRASIPSLQHDRPFELEMIS